jgi:hypothetical protein
MRGPGVRIVDNKDGLSSKSCTICSILKPLTEYGPDKRRTEGRLSSCRECEKSRKKEYDLKPWSRVLSKLGKARRRLENPDQSHAIYVAERLVYKGIKIKPDLCESCSSTKHLEGHHKDYSKPEEVEWLCKSCHTRRHHDIRHQERI